MKHRLPLLGWMLLALILDWASKLAVLTYLQPGESIKLIPDVFHLTRTHNPGAAFSLLSSQPALLTGLSALLFLGLTVFALCQKQLPRLHQLAFGLILGGAAGNLLDRFRFGTVTDFLNVTAIHYPIFNLADTFICIGAGVLLVHFLRG